MAEPPYLGGTYAGLKLVERHWPSGHVVYEDATGKRHSTTYDEFKRMAGL